MIHGRARVPRTPAACPCRPAERDSPAEAAPSPKAGLAPAPRTPCTAAPRGYVEDAGPSAIRSEGNRCFRRLVETRLGDLTGLPGDDTGTGKFSVVVGAGAQGTGR